MPKILISELDKTVAGLPSDYSDYSVLIAGFMGRQPITTAKAEADTTGASVADKIQPDSNGIYEFSNQGDFEETIGLCAPKVLYSAKTKNLYHYGNQMAYELLGMGYSIVFKPLGTVLNGECENAANLVQELASEDFWEIFRDKASYDFRFVTHGLLRSQDFIEDANTKAEIVRIDAELEKHNSCAEDLVALYKKYGVDASGEELTEEQCEANLDTFVDAGYADELFIKDEATTEFNAIKAEYELADSSAIDSALSFVYNQLDELNNDKSLLEETYKKNTHLDISKATIADTNKCIANLAKYSTGELAGRGDCIALLELDEQSYINANVNPEERIVEAMQEMSYINADNGPYCALTVPSVVYKMAIDPNSPNSFGNNTRFPGSFHYLACFVNALKSGFREWYAAAGYTRGVSSYTINYTTVKLGEIAINALEPRNSDGGLNFACNVIANFRGSYYLWGNRTAAQLKPSNSTEGDLKASHFLNIRQLCCTVKKQLYVACRRFTFDPNSDTLWFNFVNAIKPTLELMKADQGIRDYKIIKERTDKKATLKAKIRIIPIEAVEDFDLTVSLEDSFGETTAVVTE